MSRTGIIVDGPGDFAAFRARYKNGFKILKTDGPRGHTADITDIVSNSKKQITMLKGFNCEKAIIVMDFEQRGIEYKTFYDKMNRTIQQNDLGIDVFLAMPNRMIENWYLADIENISKRKKYIKNRLRQKYFEGKHGKKELKKCFIKKYSYSETKHGPELFKIIRTRIAQKNSSSFKQFLKII